MLAEREHLSEVRKYIGFVKSRQRGPEPPQMPSFKVEDPQKLESQIRRAWDEYGEDYLCAESVSAHAATMYMLLMNLKGGNWRERWLSLGSGPGLYEAFLARRYPQVSIDSLDLSAVQLRTQQGIVRRVNRRVRPFQGSMARLPFPSGAYDQLLVINALHWSHEWREAISEINRVLSPREGARVYAVVGSVPVVDGGGNGQIALGLNTDTLIDKFEEQGLRAKATGYLNIYEGQFGVPSQRFFLVAERDSSVIEPWASRLKQGQICFTEYIASGDALGIIDHR